MIVRRVQITNVYELYDTETREYDIPLDERTFETDEEWAEYLYETIHPFTGVGYVDGNSAYFVESIDGLEPVINEEW